MKLYTNVLQFLLVIILLSTVSFHQSHSLETKNIKVHDHVTDKGLNLWHLERHNLPIISVSFTFKNIGWMHDPIDKQGLTSIAMNTLYSSYKDSEGTSNQILDKLGAEVTLDLYGNSIVINMQVLSENFEQLLSIISYMFLHPTVDIDHFNTIKDRKMISFNQNLENPQNIALRELKKIIFNNNFYSQDSLGNNDTLNNITYEDVEKHINYIFDKKHLSISSSGNITTKNLSKLLDKYLSQLPSNNNLLPTLPEINYLPKVINKHVYMDTLQSTILFGCATKGILINHHDYYKAIILNNAFGGIKNSNSIIFKELRTRLAVAYSPYTTLSSDEHISFFHGVTVTDNSTARKSIEAVRNIFYNISNNGITQKDFNIAKKVLITGFMLSLDGNSNISQTLSLLQKNNLGVADINTFSSILEKITLEEVNEFAKTFFSPKNLVFIEVSNTSHFD